MEQFFVNIFKLFKAKKALFALAALLFLMTCAFLASKLSFEENIGKMLPQKAQIMRVNQTIESSGFMDRLFIHAQTTSNYPGDLTQFADSLAHSLTNGNYSHLIRSINYQVTNKAETEVFDFVQQNLPLLLTDEDYVELEKKLSTNNIEASIKNGYQLLMTPAGAWSGPLFRKDPLNLTPLGLNKLNSLRLDTTIQLHNGYYLSPDKKHLLMWLIPSNEPNETTENALMLSYLDSCIEQTQTEMVKASYFGTTAVAVGNAKRIKRDIQTTISIAFTVLLIFLTFYFKKPLTIIYLFTPVIFGASLALAALYLVKGNISAISLGIGSLIVGITIDFSLHFLNHIKSDGNPISVLKDTTRPILTSSLTTASAFLCLTLVNSDALTDLGLFAGISVIGSAIATLIVLSQLIKPKKLDKPIAPSNDFLTKISAYALEKNLKVLGVVVLISIGLLFFFKQVSFDGDMQKMNYMSEQLVQAKKDLSAINGHSEKTIYLIADGTDPETVLTENGRIGEELEKLKTKFPSIKFANSSALLISKQEQKKRLERWKQFWSKNLDSLQNQMNAASAPYGFKPKTFTPFYSWINNQPNPFTTDDLNQIEALNISAFTGFNNGHHVIFNPLKIGNESLSEIKAELKQKQIFTFDKAAFANSIVSQLQSDFSSLIWASLIVVFIILLLFFRHSLLAILTLIPIVVSWVWVTGIMSLFGLSFNIFNIIVSSLVFGLGVDYAIFITSGLLHEMKTGEKKLSVYKTSILLSALTTICGVGALIFAKHPALHSMALISIIGIGASVLISFTLQAFLIRVLIVNRSLKGYQPYSTFSLLNTLWTFVFFLTGCLIAFISAYLIFPLIPIKKEKKVAWVTWFSSRWMRAITDHQMHIKQTKGYPNIERLKKPSVIIANHESFLDILIILGMYPKNILLTNDWVYTSPFFGKIVQYAGFYPVSRGFEEALPHLKKKVEEGYNICVFPEGTRSRTPMLSRFHKGAFYVAQQLELDVVPVVFHGYGHLMAKGDDFLLKAAPVEMRTLEVAKHGDKKWGETDRERYKSITRNFKTEFYKIRREIETASYYYNQLKNNYLYKGVKLETQAKNRLKMHTADFDAINDQLTDKCNVLVVGDTLGLLALFLTYHNAKRNITGLFKNQNDLNLASHCFSYRKNEQSHFQLINESVDYSQFEFVVIDAEMAQLNAVDCQFLVEEALNNTSETAKVILSNCFLEKGTSNNPKIIKLG